MDVESRRLYLALTFVAALAWAAAVPGQEVGKDWLLEPLQGKAEARPTVRVENLHGNVQVRGFPEAGVEIHGTVQRHTDDPRKPELEVTEEDGQLRVAVRYPQDEPGFEAPDAWRKRRTDLTVFVPHASRLEVVTRHGRARVKGIEGDVRAESESGDLDVATSGVLEARSNYGMVWGRLGASTWPRPHVIETLTGEIRVDLPWESQPHAVLETRGQISSDYSIQIDWLPGSRAKRGTVAVGEGSGSLRLTSERGDVRILRKPSFEPDP